ncbi:MAG: FHA domain-containing protein [Planctomycetes bacterium]|nr:FHA domain-containing protein [Planctomycetota bacterium]
MQGGSRYCIQCGQDMGDSPFCTNPECDGLPNFYRHVPAPERVGGPPGQAGRAGPGPTPRRAGRAPETEDPSVRRTTMGLQEVPVAFLRATSPPHREEPLLLGENDVGARAPARIVIDRPQVSARHAQVQCRLDAEHKLEVTVVDLGSKNGTYVNGKRVQRHALAPGDRVRFAAVEFELRLVAQDEPRVTIGL